MVGCSSRGAVQSTTWLPVMLVAVNAACCTDRCCPNKQTGARKESKPLYYSRVLWTQAVRCWQGVTTTNTCKLLLQTKITSHLHGTGTCSADHSTKAKLRILPHALIASSLSSPDVLAPISDECKHSRLVGTGCQIAAGWDQGLSQLCRPLLVDEGRCHAC